LYRYWWHVNNGSWCFDNRSRRFNRSWWHFNNVSLNDVGNCYLTVAFIWFLRRCSFFRWCFFRGGLFLGCGFRRRSFLCCGFLNGLWFFWLNVAFQSFTFRTTTNAIGLCVFNGRRRALHVDTQIGTQTDCFFVRHAELFGELSDADLLCWQGLCLRIFDVAARPFVGGGY
jgi:hypothetical protein